MVELILLLAGAIGYGALHRRIARLEREVAELRGQAPPLAAPQSSVEEPVRRAPARVVGTVPMVAPEPAAPWPEPNRPRRKFDFETLVGGKLPIWIGGIALILAGFFLVRLSIESGWLRPGMRTLIAAAFALLLVAASEVARRHALTRDDPRIGQALAGAGVASAYGTLYIAAAQYHLIGALAAFVLMIAVTAAGLFLALRQGPPTAVMALVGGFAAPLVAGYDAAGVGPLLAYLALFTTALFALAAQRGWTWLAVAAVVAGFGWANLLLALVGRDDLNALAAFVVVLAVAATLALPRAGATSPRLRVAPLVAGLVQLLALAPQLEFGATAWIFYLVLSAAALALAWRDATLLPGALAAAVVVLVLLAAAQGEGSANAATTFATIAAAALFGTTGALLSRRDARWAAIALAGIAGPVLIAHAAAPARLPAAGWSLLELVAAAVSGWIAWQHRDRTDARDVGLIGGSAMAAALAAVAVATLLGAPWWGVALTLAMIALAVWARRMGDAHLALLPGLALGAAVLLALPELGALASAGLRSLAGEALVYPLLPPLADVLRGIAVPAGAALALLWWHDAAFGAARRPVGAVAVALLAASAYVAAKQVLAIGDPARFVASGFGERAAITLAFLAAGWALTRHPKLARLGQALAAFAVARFVLLDLIVFNPLFVAQSVGPFAVGLPLAIALAAATIAPSRPWRLIALAAAVVTVIALVRQIAHGSILTGPVGNGETWGYSAVLLLLAIGWLWRGVAAGAHDLRLAGLALLTVVTLKVFLIDVAALGGVLRILSFLGLGVALIGIGWAYSRVMRAGAAPADSVPAAG